MCHGVQKGLSVRIFGPSKSFCRLFLWKKTATKIKGAKKCLDFGLVATCQHPIRKFCCWPTEKSTEGACNQRNAVLLADFEGEMPGAALRYSRLRNIFTNSRGFFFLLGDARNIDRSKGDEFPKFLPVFFFLGGMGYDLFSLYIVPFSFLSLNLAEV